VYGLDVSNAFARADVDEHLHVMQPIGYTNRDKNGVPYVCRLKKGLYGTKQAARLWHETLRRHLLADGWQQYETDTCIFSRHTSRFGHEFVGVYVDDIVHSCSSQAAHTAFHTYCTKAFPTKSQGILTWILGMEIKRDRSTRTLTLNQSRMMLALLDDCDMRDARPLTSPMDPNWKYGTGAHVVDDDRKRDFQSRVGSLSYMAQCTRPDISLAVNRLARHLSKPNENCYKALHHLLRYCSHTPDLGIKYHQGTSTSLRLEAYSDSTYGGEDCDTAKSQTGNLIYFGGGLVDWSSHLQSVIALSSAEAEQMAAFSASRSVVHFRQLLEELGHKQLDTTTVWVDNTAAISQSRNPIAHQRTRHVLIRYHYLRELHNTGIVRLEYICTRDQVADILTKPLPPKDFARLAPFIVSTT